MDVDYFGSLRRNIFIIITFDKGSNLELKKFLSKKKDYLYECFNYWRCWLYW